MADQNDSEREEDLFLVGQDTKSEEEFEWDEAAVNIVTEFKEHPEGRACLKRLSAKCLEDFESAWDASEDYRKKMGDVWKFFSGDLKPKDIEFQNLSNAHVPILMVNTIRMVSRQAYELFGNWTNVFGVTPIGPDDEKTAKLLSLHGNWQIRKRIKDFKRQIGHRGLMAFNLFGDVTVHSWWDPYCRSNRHEVLTANEFVCANAHVSTMPDYSDVSWVAKILFKDAHEMRKMEGNWEDIGTTLKHLPPEWDEVGSGGELREAVDKSLGVDSSVFRKGQYTLIQYEGWLNLPPTTKKDTNGEEREASDRYCKVVIDRQTQTVLALGIHERVDPYEKKRFEFETQQLQAYQQGMAAIQSFMQEQQQTVMSALAMAHEGDPTGDGPAQGVMMARAVEEMPPPPEPPMPDWMQGDPNAQPRQPDKRPIRMFAHGVNIEPMQGVLGLGTGSIHLDLNRASNMALSAFADQTMLNNTKNFLATNNFRLPGGDKLILAPGKIHHITGAIDLSKEFVPLEFGPASPALLTMIEMFTKYGNEVSNTPEVLAGESGKSGETAQGLSARIEQATKMLSVPTGKYADMVTVVLENNATLNAIFMEDVEFFSVNNHDPMLGELGRQTFNVGREMYDRPYDVEFSADLKFTSTAQRISEADALVQMPGSVMPLQGNFAFWYETVKKSLEARDRHDLVAKLGPPPPPPPFFGAPTSPPAPPPGAPPPGEPPGEGAPPQGQPPQQGAQQ